MNEANSLSDQQKQTLARFRENKLLSAYMTMQQEYEEIQNHNIDPNQPIERDDYSKDTGPVIIPDPEPDSEKLHNTVSALASLSSDNNSTKEHGVFSMEDFMSALQEYQQPPDNKISLKDEKKRLPITIKLKKPSNDDKTNNNDNGEISKAIENADKNPPVIKKESIKKPPLLAMPADIQLLVEEHVSKEVELSNQTEKQKELQKTQYKPNNKK